MKNLLKFFGIIALVAIVGFTLISCGDGSYNMPAGEEPPPPPPPDTSTWQVRIAPTETLNGIAEEIGDPTNTKVLYATGTINALAFEAITGGLGVRIKDSDEFDETDKGGGVPYSAADFPKIYIPAQYSAVDPIDSSTKKWTAVYKPVIAILDEGFDGADLATVEIVVLANNTEDYVTAAQKTYNLKTIGDDAFATATGLATFVITEGVTAIGDAAFKNTVITSVAIPATVKTIGDEAFSDVSAITEVTFAPDSVIESIGEEAFLGVGAVQIISLPETLTTIGNKAFGPSIVHVKINDASALTDVGTEIFGSKNAGTVLIYGLGKGKDGFIATAAWNEDGSIGYDDPATDDDDESLIGSPYWYTGITSPATVVFDDVVWDVSTTPYTP